MSRYGYVMKKIWVVLLTAVLLFEAVGINYTSLYAETKGIKYNSSYLSSSAVRVEYKTPLNFELVASDKGEGDVAWFYAPGNTENLESLDVWTLGIPVAPGTYCISARYKDNEGNIQSVGRNTAEKALITITSVKIAPPTNPVWSSDHKTISWTAPTTDVNGRELDSDAIDKVSALIYIDNSSKGYSSGMSTSADFSSYINGPGVYSIHVTAYPDNDDMRYLFSDDLVSRFAIVKINIEKKDSISEATLSEPGYVMADGKSALELSVTKKEGYEGDIYIENNENVKVTPLGSNRYSLSVDESYIIKSTTVRVAASDITAPEITSFTDADGKLTVTATDKGTGVSEYAFSTSATAPISGWSKDNTGLPETAGKCYAYVKDAAGNVAKSETAIDVYSVTYVNWEDKDAEHTAVRSGSGTYELLTPPSKEGYNFVGWYDNSSFSGSPLTSITGNGNKTVYGKWERGGFDYYLTVDRQKLEGSTVVAEWMEDSFQTGLDYVHHVGVVLNSTAGSYTYRWEEQMEDGTYKVIDREVIPSDLPFSSPYRNGNYRVTVTQTIDGTGISVVKEFTIAMPKKNLEITATAATDTLVYGDDVPELSPDYTSDMDWSWIYLDNFPLKTDYAKGSGAGSYRVYVDLDNLDTKSETYKVQAKKFNISYKDTYITVVEKEVPLSDVSVTVPVGPYKYTGYEVCPEPVVKIANSTLDKSEYTVTYADNVDAGTATATVVLNNYKITDGENTVASVSADFTIDRKSLENDDQTNDIEIETIENIEYDGLIHTPETVITQRSLSGKRTLVYGTDYEVTYVRYDNETQTNSKDVGRVYVDITGIGNYKDTVRKQFWITGKNVTVVPDELEKAYGTSDPELTYEVDGLVGDDTKDMITAVLSRADGEAVGTYTIGGTADETQGNYIVSVDDSKLFTITPQEIRNADFEKFDDVEFDNMPHTPEVHASYNGVTLVEGKDFTVSYKHNKFDPEFKENGIVVITITGCGDNFTGTVKKQFNINKKEITVTADDAEKIYGEEDPEFTATVSEGILDGQEIVYTVYRDPRFEEKANSTAYIIVTGEAEQGNYSIKYVDGNLKINPKSISDVEIEFEDIEDVIYTGGPLTQDISAVYHSYYKDEKLSWLNDYYLHFTHSVDDSIIQNVGTVTVVVEGRRNFTGTKTLTYNILPKQADVYPEQDIYTKNLNEKEPVYKYRVEGLVEKDAADQNSPIEASISRDSDPGEEAGTYTVRTYGETVQGNYIVTYHDAVLIIKGEYDGTKSAEVKAKYGHTSSLDLKSYSLPEGYIFDTENIRLTDENGVVETISLDGTVVNFKFADVSENAGKSAVYEIPVSSSNYQDFVFTVTLNVIEAEEMDLKFEESELNRTYGDDNFVNTLTGAADGSELTFSSSDENVASVNPLTGEVTINGAGTCTIMVEASETDEYASADAQYTLKVAKAEYATGWDDIKDVKDYTGKTEDLGLPEGWEFAQTPDAFTAGGIVEANVVYNADDKNSFENTEKTFDIYCKAEILNDITSTVYTIGVDSSAVIHCTGELDLLQGVYVDDMSNPLDPANYTLEEGSTIVTFNKEYLDSLAVGKHDVKLEYRSCDVMTNLTIRKIPVIPGIGPAIVTGVMSTGTYGGLSVLDKFVMLCSLLVAVFALIKNRKDKVAVVSTVALIMIPLFMMNKFFSGKMFNPWIAVMMVLLMIELVLIRNSRNK